MFLYCDIVGSKILCFSGKANTIYSQDAKSRRDWQESAYLIIDNVYGIRFVKTAKPGDNKKNMPYHYELVTKVRDCDEYKRLSFFKKKKGTPNEGRSFLQKMHAACKDGRYTTAAKEEYTGFRRALLKFQFGAHPLVLNYYKALENFS